MITGGAICPFGEGFLEAPADDGIGAPRGRGVAAVMPTHSARAPARNHR